MTVSDRQQLSAAHVRYDTGLRVFWRRERQEPREVLPTVEAAPFDWRTRAVELGMSPILIAGERFAMGSTIGDPDEQPIRMVNVPQFYLSRSEVTVAQYRACVDAGVCREPVANDDGCNWGVAGREQHPINCLNWRQSRRFSRWVGGDLPSEAEWEFAARSRGKDRVYPWGNRAPNCAAAMMDDERSRSGETNVTSGCGLGHTAPVCTRRSGDTVEGLCDMSGNIREFTLDRYAPSYHQAPRDGSPRCLLDSCNVSSKRRVLRGGGWRDGPRILRAAMRQVSSELAGSSNNGFRVRWTIEAPTPRPTPASPTATQEERRGSSHPLPPPITDPPETSSPSTTPPSGVPTVTERPQEAPLAQPIRSATAHPDRAPSTSANHAFRRFGEWIIRADDAGLLIEYAEPEETRLFFPRESPGGQFFLINRSGSFRVLDSERSTPSAFPAPQSGHSLRTHRQLPTLSEGTTALGQWTITRRGDDLTLRHPANQFYLRLWSGANGWWDIRFSDGREEKTISSQTPP